MKKLLYIPQYTMQNKTTGKFVLDADENVNIFQYVVEEAKRKKIDCEFYVVLPEVEQVEFTPYMNLYNFLLEHGVTMYYKRFPSNNVLQRYNFDVNFYTDLIKEVNPDIIINNVDALSRNLRAVCEMAGKKDIKIYTFIHFIDLPGANLTGESYSYFCRQVDSTLASDATMFLSKRNTTEFYKNTPGYLKKKIRPKLQTVPIVFSARKFEKLRHTPTINFGKSPWQDYPLIVFPNRLSSNNYSHHIEFFDAVNQLHDEGLKFKVIVTNPSQQIIFDELVKMVKPLWMPFSARLMTKEEYYAVMKSADYVCALFREIHGGTAIREAILMGSFPIMPLRNDYILLADNVFNEIEGFKTIEPDLSNLKEVLRYYIENAKKFSAIDRKPIYDKLAKIESVEKNFRKFLKVTNLNDK